MNGIVVFLNGARGLAVLTALRQAGHGVMSVVVPPKLADGGSEAAKVCGRLGLTPEGVANVNDPGYVAELAARKPALLLVAGFSTIFRKPLLAAAAHGAFNLHAGRLPQYRGGSPLNWQIINGERAAGLSVIRLDEGIDTGDVLAETELPIGDEDTIADLHERANRAFPALVLECIERLEKGNLPSRRQDSAQACLWHQRSDADGHIRWGDQTAAEVHRLVRALTRPYPCAFAMWKDRRVRVIGTGVPELLLRGLPGRVCYMQGSGPFVVCRDRAILLKSYEIEGVGDSRLPHGVHLR